jgi:hypothetical protein
MDHEPKHGSSARPTCLVFRATVHAAGRNDEVDS